MIRFLRSSLRGDNRGAALIELALAMPFLAALVIGMTDLSRAFSMKLQLEQAAQRAIEKVEQQRSVSTDYSTLSTEATSAATTAGFSSSTATVDYWLECNGTRQGDGTAGNGFNNSCPNATDTTARYVTVNISSDYSPLFASTAWPGANANGTVTLTGKAGVRIQ